MSAPAEVARLKAGYYNSENVGPGNPGGLSNNGHEVNFPAALVDLATVADWVGGYTDTAVAAVEADRADAAASKAAAAGSVTAAAAQVALAVGQVAAATAEADRATDEADRATGRADASALSAAAAAQSAAAAAASSGLPTIAGPADAGKAIVVSTDGSGYVLGSVSAHQANLFMGII